jgi:hypothetical protein
LNHRLVQISLRLLRAEVWSPASKKGLHRLSACIVPDTALSDPAVIAFARLVVIGGDQNRLHEEIIAAGGFIKEGRLVRMNVTQVTNALNAMTDREPSSALRNRLIALYPRLVPALLSALEARSKDRLDGIQKLLAERVDFEARSMEAILTELANAIRKELAEPEVVQLELWTSEEKEQLNRNMDALRRRLMVIPGEIKQEEEVIRKRFASPKERIFPVAVLFLVPEKMTR